MQIWGWIFYMRRSVSSESKSDLKMEKKERFYASKFGGSISPLELQHYNLW